jgi:hypothetical protein
MLQTRRAGVMAALSSKVQQDSLLLLDSFTLPEEQSQECLRQKITDMAGSIKAVETYFPPQRLQRERFFTAIDGDESLLTNDDGEKFDDATVTENIMQRCLENKEPLIPLFMNTGALNPPACPFHRHAHMQTCHLD